MNTDHNDSVTLTQIVSDQKFISATPILNKSEFRSIIKKAGVKEGHTILYLDYAIRFCYWDGEKFSTENGGEIQDADMGYLQSARIFNNSQELYLWKTDAQNFQGRVRTDEASGNQMDIIEVWQFIKPLNLEYLAAESQPKRIRVRNYVDYNASGLAGFVDTRLVGYADENRHLL